MTRTEIIAGWRNMVADTVGQDSNRFWNNAEATELFADACDAFCSETRYFVGAMVDAVSLVPLVSGKRHYKLHPAIISVDSVRPSWKNGLLDKNSVEDMDADSPGWMEATGRPTDWLLDYESDYLSLSHAPTTDSDSIRLTVVRRQVDNSLEALEIPQQWHKYLKYHMAYQAMFKQDSEITGAVKIGDFKTTWDNAIEQIKRDILRMRKSSISISFTGGV